MTYSVVACLFLTIGVCADARGHALASEGLGSQSLAAAPATVSPSNVASVLWENIYHQLTASTFQWVNALIMLLFGKLMVWDGQVSFKVTMTCFAGLLTFILAESQIKVALEDQLGAVPSLLIAIEFGLLACWVVWSGFLAVQYAIGAILGYMFAHWIQLKATDVFQGDVADSQWFYLINTNIWVVLGLYLFHASGKMNKIVLTVVSSIFGGAFIAASMGYFINLLATVMPSVFAKMNIDIDTSGTPKAGFWIDYLLCILSSAKKDVGVFTKNTGAKLTIFGETWYLDCILGRVAWMTFFVLGLVIAWKIHPIVNRKKEDGKPARNVKGKPSNKNDSPPTKATKPTKTPDQAATSSSLPAATAGGMKSKFAKFSSIAKRGNDKHELLLS